MRLIDADVLLERFVEKGQRSNRYKLGENWELNFPEIYDVVNQQPPIDAEPIRHGHWEYVKKRLVRGGYVDANKCSICHKIIMPHLKPNYCPHCGAKMDGGNA